MERYHAAVFDKLYLSLRKEIKMKYEKLIEEIVNSLLDETTFLQAYKQGILSKEDILAASKIRKTASKRYGQKIPVTGTDNNSMREFSSAVTKGSLKIWQEMDREEGARSSLMWGPSERLQSRLRIKQNPFVTIDISDAKKMPGTLGHELGHILDPEQNEDERFELIRANRLGVKDREGDKATVKAEAKAWKIGKDLHKESGTFSPEEEKAWRQLASTSLRTYTQRRIPSSYPKTNK